jgi:hypothetical protein
MPFYHGQRACTGMNLGKFLVKSVLVSVLSQFEVEADPNFEAMWFKGFAIDMP